MQYEQQPPKTSGLAITSLVTGILGLGPVAVVCGHIALSRIKESAGTLGGKGMATAGLVIGYVMLSLTLLMMLALVFIGSKAWKKGSDRAACIMYQRNVQITVRNHQSLNHLKAGDRIDWSKITLPEGYKQTTVAPCCPEGGFYQFVTLIPANGDLAVKCPDAARGHVPADHHDW